MKKIFMTIFLMILFITSNYAENLVINVVADQPIEEIVCNRYQNYSFSFTTGNYGRIPMSSSLSNFDTFTLEFWYFETGGHGSDEYVVGTEYFTGTQYYVGSFLERLWPGIDDGSQGLGIVYDGTNPDAGISYNTNTWYYIALTYDGSMLRFFIDGVLVYSESGSLGQFGPTDEDLVINRHRWATGSSSRLSGQLDELRISDIARYVSNFDIPSSEFETDPNTMGLWHFNQDFIDYSGNGNNGQNIGTGYSTNTPPISTLPVVLTSFTAGYTVNNGNDFVSVDWSTASEVDINGFNIYRSKYDEFSYAERINDELIPATNTTQTQVYSYYDEGVLIQNIQAGDEFWYWLEIIELSGLSNVHNKPAYLKIPEVYEPEIPPELPIIYGLYQNVPNPFNPSIMNTKICFNLLQNSNVRIDIYNVKGQLVRNLFNGYAEFGESGNPRVVNWNGRNENGIVQESGIYFYKMSVGGVDKEVKKLLLIR